MQKQFVYYKADNLTRKVNGYGGYPQTLTPEFKYTKSYEYDKSGHILLAQSGESNERVVYELAANQLNQNSELAKANQLNQYNGYQYDVFGRLSQRIHTIEGSEQYFITMMLKTG